MNFNRDSMMQLISAGAQDIILMNPAPITFFKQKFYRYSNFSYLSDLFQDVSKHKKLFLSKELLDYQINDYCPICHDDFNLKEEIHKTSCKHIFHYNCLLKYLETVFHTTYNCHCCRKIHEKEYC